MSNNLADYTDITGLQNDDVTEREFLLYTREARVGSYSYQEDDSQLPAFWQGLSVRFPNLARVAQDYIWFPIVSADAERSFSMYKHLLTPQRERLAEDSVRMLTMLHFNKIDI